MEKLALLCALFAIASAVNDDPSKAKEICAELGSDSILVAHEDCHYFYKCYRGEPVPIYCGPNLVYNPVKEYCDWPQNYACKSQGNAEKEQETAHKEPKGNSDPSQAKEICAAENSDGILIAHEDCSKFYKCFEGSPAALDCPDNLLFNPDKEYCDWPENVQCSRVRVIEAA